MKRELKLIDATMLVVGSMIGSGIFIVSADIARNVGSAGWLIAVWVVSGIMTLIPAVSYGELSGMYPQAGGQYVYLREAYNPLIGFLYGWTFFLVNQCGTIAAVAVAFAKYTGVIIPWFSEKHVLFAAGDFKITAAQLLALLQIALLTYINIRGVREGKRGINEKFIIGAKKAFPDYRLEELFYFHASQIDDHMMETTVNIRYNHIVQRLTNPSS